MTDDPRPRLARAHEEFDRRIRHVHPPAWGMPTPCADWSVRDLVGHVVYENRWAPHLLRGETLDAVGSRYDGDVLGDDPQRAWASAAQGCVTAASAAALDRTVHTSFGDITAEFYVWQLTAEHLVHAWDLAQAIDGDVDLDATLVDAVAAWFTDHEQLYRQLGVVAEPPPAPADASAQTRLLAAFGRRAT